MPDDGQTLEGALADALAELPDEDAAALEPT